MLKKLLYKVDRNIRTNKKVQKIILACFLIIALIFAYFILNYKDLVEVYNLSKSVENKLENMKISVGGEAVGIKLLATGVLVMGLDRDDTLLQVGDIILKADDKKVESNAELIDISKQSDKEEILLEINRQGVIIHTKITKIYDEIAEEYKLGLWVKDSSAGVGTITFYDLNSNKFAALGHGVTETKENYILPITAGGITNTTIYSIKKGAVKSPGELKGSITSSIIGQIMGNTDKGIYGEITELNFLKARKEIQILPKTKIKESKAKILCTLDDNIKKEYDIEIEKVLLTSSGNKNMIVKITDEELLNKTGGIIQGMSGSPIIQDGKLVGAITHVFLNDPTRGYGVFVENMIEDMCEFDKVTKNE